jgi:hypothetical protein
MEKEEKANITLPGRVEKIIERPPEASKAQISVETADPLYKEIRVQNELKDQAGNPVELKPGVQVDVTIEADQHAVQPKRTD